MYRQFIFIILSSCFILQSIAACTQNYRSYESCPTFWTAYRDHCYRFFERPANWVEAEKNCRNHGAPNGLGAAHLITLHSAQEEDVAVELVSQSSASTTSFLIGFTDAVEEGVFKWVDDAPVNYVNWIPREPTNSDGQGDENCAALNIEKKQWNDINCDYVERSYICKMQRF